MELKGKQQWLVPLIFSYVGSIFLYTLSTGYDRVMGIISMIIVISLLFYSLYIIWKKYQGEVRTKYFIHIALFALILHGATFTLNYFFQGIIAFLAGLILIYIYFKKVFEV